MSVYDVRDMLKAAEPSAFPHAPSHADRPAPPLAPAVVAGYLRGIELLVVAAAGLAAHWIVAGFAAPVHHLLALAIGGVAVTAIMGFQVLRAYRFRALQTLPKTILKLAIGLTLACLAEAAAMAVAGASGYRWLAVFYAVGLGALVIERCALVAFMRRAAARGAFDRRTAIVGGGAAGEELICALEAGAAGGVRVVGVFDDRDDDRSSDVVAGYPKLGAVNDLVDYARRSRVDLIIFTLPITAEARILQMLTKLWVLPIDIRLSAHASKLRLRPRAYSYLGDVPVLDVFDRPLGDWDMVAKSLFDRVIALCALVALAVPMIAVALAVKLTSKGPVLFKQKRYGFNNELIEVYKFRSMYVDQGDAAAAKLVTKDDPRVTPVGRIIRKTSLDELPQLFNVLRGELSLVGPRPHALQAKAANTLYDQVVDGYFARHKVKPGITGWAQINGWRGETDTSEKIQKRVEHDLYYIENWSILFDLKILAKTPLSLLKTENAY